MDPLGRLSSCLIVWPLFIAAPRQTRHHGMFTASDASEVEMTTPLMNHAAATIVRGTVDRQLG